MIRNKVHLDSTRTMQILTIAAEFHQLIEDLRNLFQNLSENLRNLMISWNLLEDLRILISSSSKSWLNRKRIGDQMDKVFTITSTLWTRTKKKAIHLEDQISTLFHLKVPMSKKKF